VILGGYPLGMMRKRRADILQKNEIPTPTGCFSKCLLFIDEKVMHHPSKTCYIIHLC
jgi:hypothetical protein